MSLYWTGELSKYQGYVQIGTKKPNVIEFAENTPPAIRESFWQMWPAYRAEILAKRKAGIRSAFSPYLPAVDPNENRMHYGAPMVYKVNQFTPLFRDSGSSREMIRLHEQYDRSRMSEYEKDDTAVDPLADAIGMAGAVGVKVALTGVPPAEGRPRVILAAAIRECATNTAKHAEGDRLSADVQHSETGFTFTLRSNGTPPGETIRESGGLASLRTLVENQNGSMRVESFPEFCLTISVPQEDHT